MTFAASATDPAGTLVRGELRRGTSQVPSSAVRYPKPGAKPQNSATYSIPQCRSTTPSTSVPHADATNARSGPS